MIVLILSFLAGYYWQVPDIENTSNLERALSIWTIWVKAGLWLIITSAMGLLAYELYRAVHRSLRDSSRNIPAWIPVLSTLVFAVLVGLIHVYGWVPLWLAALLVSPCIFLPPLAYRIVPQSFSKDNALFTMEDKARIRDNANVSPLIREFLERYPTAEVFVYKNTIPYSSGGLILFNRERLPTVRTTFMEVVLECPFAAKPGVLAEGRETLYAYLARHQPRGTKAILLPPNEWEEWIRGMAYSEWMQHIESLDRIDPEYPTLGHIPICLFEKNLPWQRFSLR